MERKLEGLSDSMEEREEGIRTLIGEDFNAKMREGGWIEENQEKDEKDRKG